MKYIKLEKIFKYLPKSKIKAGEGKDKGVFPFFTSSSIYQNTMMNIYLTVNI